MRIAGRRLLAVLAGGVVLAGGGITTLASWQDQTYDQAPLKLSKFNVEQTLNDISWSESDVESAPAQLTLSIPSIASTALTPGGATVGWVGLRVVGGSVGGSVKMSGAALGTDSGAIAGLLSYQAVAGVDLTTCRSGVLPSTGTGITVLAANDSALTTSTNSSFRLEPGTSGAVGATVGVCFKVKLSSSAPRLVGGNQLSPTWTFSATSDE